MPVSHPCGICTKPVAHNHRAIECDICKLWIHIKCNFISKERYFELIEEDESNKWTYALMKHYHLWT